MRETISWTEARDLLLERVHPVELETVSLDECAGRILGFDLKAAEDVPPFDRSAYDGYAFRAADTDGASLDHPVTLRITETIPAGMMASIPVTPGTAVHLMTGAAIPDGADCVIMFERTVFTSESVTLSEKLRPGDNIVRRGEDVTAGTLLASCGAEIDPGTAGTLAAQGIGHPTVFRRPVIGLISTGSEVVEAEDVQRPGTIRNANRASFTALLQREGCIVNYLGLAGDDPETIAGLLRQGLTVCDAIILTGGVSVGDWDVTPEAMERAGVEILARGVDMKPGMACAYGEAGGKLVLGLSGNPASAVTNCCACVLPAIRRLCGRAPAMPSAFRASLKNAFQKKSPSARFLRGRLEWDGERTVFTSSSAQGNAVLSSTIGCDAFLLIPAGSGPVDAGTVLDGFLV